MQVGFDRETGKIDIDRIATGIGASQRSHIITIKEVIADLEKKFGKMVPMEQIISEAKNRGVESGSVEEAVDKLKRSGDIFEPKRGTISRLE